MESYTLTKNGLPLIFQVIRQESNPISITKSRVFITHIMDNTDFFSNLSGVIRLKKANSL